MNYLNQQNLNKLFNIAMNVNFFKNIIKKYICECYIMSRQKMIFYNNFITSDILSSEFVYNDLIESLTFINFNDYKYFMMFKNDFIYYFEIYYIYYKSEIFIMFLRFKTHLKFRDYRINRIRLDNEGEYINKIFFKCFAQTSIKQKFIIVNNFEINEAAERFD